MRRKAAAIHEIREEVFQRRGLAWFRIPTGSMRPLIEPGELALAQWIGAGEARVGDIVLYREGVGRSAGAGDVWVAHRLVGVATRDGREFFLVKGDAGSVPEELAPEAVRGRVIVVEKAGGRTLRLGSVRGRIVDGYLKWKNCRERGPGASSPAACFLRRVARAPAAALQAALFRIFL